MQNYIEKGGLKRNILIVDDNAGIRTTLQILLDGKCAAVETIASPKVLVSTVQRFRPDVILLDMNFESDINTGNEVLDVVLSEKAILCEKNGIHFSCMACGKPFAFLTAAQTYSLFGNIIDNAIEALQYVDDPELKVISLVCNEQDGCAVIEESNYYAGELFFADGIPTTRKQDAARHGFGVRSMRYIVEQYGGTLELKAVDNMFFLSVRFPKRP